MSQYVIGADIGGTTVKLGVFSMEGSLVDKWEIPTRTEEEGRYILQDIADSCLAYMDKQGLERKDFAGIGMGVPGTVNEDGSVNTCVNLGWGYREVRREMEEILKIPAWADNDANAAGLGEMWKGGAKGMTNLIMVTLGTGVGGGIIIDGKTIRGSHGYGGEIGHITIHPEETLSCNCGRKGCLEQYCSANGIARLARAGLESWEGTTRLADLEEITCRDVFDAAKDGDEYALARVEAFGKDLGMTLANLAAITDPQVFVIGGGVSKAGKMVTDVVEKYFRRYALAGQREVGFRLAVLGNDAGIYGCARLALGDAVCQ